VAVNELKVNQQHAIVALYQQGWSKRKIARELGVDRSAVRRYLAGADSKPPTNPQTGSEVNNPAATVECPAATISPAEVLPAEPPSNPRTGVLALGGGGLDSLCEPWKEFIQAALACTVFRIEYGSPEGCTPAMMVLRLNAAGSGDLVANRIQPCKWLGTEERPGLVLAPPINCTRRLHEGFCIRRPTPIDSHKALVFNDIGNNQTHVIHIQINSPVEFIWSQMGA